MSGIRDKERSAHLISGLKESKMKSYSLPISGSDSRIKVIYEAPSDTQHGSECIKTIYVYIGTSASVLLSKEVSATWDVAFETASIAKATADLYTAEELAELEIK